MDDDPGLRGALADLLESMGYEVATYGSTGEFLARDERHAPGCLVLDVRLPGMSGLDLQEHLARDGVNLPVILMTSFADVPMSVRGMKAGARDFLEKPFRDQDMLDAIADAVEASRRSAGRGDFDQHFSRRQHQPLRVFHSQPDDVGVRAGSECCLEGAAEMAGA